MTQEQLRMQMLAGIITESQYKEKLNEFMIPIINRPSSRQTVQPNKISTKLNKPSSSSPSPSIDSPEKQTPILNPGEFLVTYRDRDHIKYKKIIKSPDLKSVEKIFWDEMGPNTMGKYVVIDIQ
jgi:hypothetical protein